MSATAGRAVSYKSWLGHTEPRWGCLDFSLKHERIQIWRRAGGLRDRVCHDEVEVKRSRFQFRLLIPSLVDGAPSGGINWP